MMADAGLQAELLRLIAAALEEEHKEAARIAAVHPDHRASARNLVHYAALRRFDLRLTQEALTRLGLSSLGRSEGAVLANLIAVARAHAALLGIPAQEFPAPPVEIFAGRARLEQQSRALFGPGRGAGFPRIMVTMPSEAKEDKSLLIDLLRAGMDVARINTAHDDPETWHGIIDQLKAAEAATGKRCKIHVDLAGPKFRVGALGTLGRLARVHPRQGLRGEVCERGFLALRAAAALPSKSPADAEIIVPPSVLAEMAACDALTIRDCRGSERTGHIERTPDGSLRAAFDRTLYLEEGAPILWEREGERLGEFTVRGLLEVQARVKLRRGDRVVLHHGELNALPENLQALPRIPCSHREIILAGRLGHRIGFDDGLILGVIEEVRTEALVVRVTDAPASGRWLGSEKGINLPDSEIDLPAVTADDRAAFESLSHRADLFGLSFVRHESDVREFAARLESAGVADRGIILKIENRSAFKNLRSLLLAGLVSPPLGIMIARGDLAVELGFSRLAEAQEETLWFAEAAHVPVIWATQVLESLAKRGHPSRAEVSDAALAVRAECVMLNKGPYIADAVRFLGETLGRMQEHQSKKRALLRRLTIAD